MPKVGSNKTKLTLWVDKNILAEAMATGLNLSAFLELRIREYLAMVKSYFNGEFTPPAGFEPATTGLTVRRSTS